MFSLDQPGCRGILVSHRRCNPLPKLRGLKPHKSVLQFCRREVRRGSHWAHAEVLADKFLSGGLRGKPVSSACRGSGSQRPPTFSSTREPLSPPSQPTALGLCVFPQLTRWPPASTFKGPVIALGGPSDNPGSVPQLKGLFGSSQVGRSIERSALLLL